MAEMINQCCYTHTGAWIPVAQKGVFDEKYIGELARHSTLPGPEYEENLAVFETVGDGDKFLIMRTQYGLRDLSTESGRASMFSHGYLIDTSADRFDPNAFLTIDKDNFCTNETEANKEKICFHRIENFALKTAMADAGLTEKSFSKLLKCVYQLAVRSVNKQSLYIQVKDERQSLSLLYCIYLGLIPKYSKYLSSASTEYNFSNMRNIVFIKSVNPAKKYFIPETGENNVLSANVEKNIDSLYFVDYPAKLCNSEEAIWEYHATLEKRYKTISYSKQIDDNVLRLAHIMTVCADPDCDKEILADNDVLMSILDLAKEYSKEKENDSLRLLYIDKLQKEAKRRGLIKEETDISSNVRNALHNDTPNINFQQQDYEIYKKQRDKKIIGSETSQNFLKIDYRDRPEFDLEKRKFKENLDEIAKGGANNLQLFSGIVEKKIKDEYAQPNAASSCVLAEIISDAICEMVNRSVQDKQMFFRENPLSLFGYWCDFLRLSAPITEQLKSKIVLQYWKSFKWVTFVPEKYKEYEFFAVKNNGYVCTPQLFGELAVKSDSVNEIACLVLHTSEWEAEEWLLELNRICLRNRILRADRKTLTQILSGIYLKSIASKRNKNDLYDDSFAAKYLIAFAVYFQRNECEKCCSAWQSVRLALNEKSSGKRKAEMEEAAVSAIEEIVSMSYRQEQNKLFVADSTYNYFVKLDKKCGVVPFDFWLALGKGEENNPFDIFNEYEYEPAIMKESIDEIVESSILLSDDYYRDNLVNYAPKKKSKFIKKLLDAVDKEKKYKKKNGKGHKDKCDVAENGVEKEERGKFLFGRRKK